MTRKIYLALAIAAAALFSASTSSAQSNKSLSLGISGGAAIPVGDLGEDLTTGYNGTVSLMFRSFGLDLAFSMQSPSARQMQTSSTTCRERGSLRI